MFPAQERLEPGNPARRGRNDRLVIKLQIAIGHGIAQIFLELRARLGSRVQILGVKMVAPATAILGRVQRQVGIANEFFAVRSMVGRNCDSDRRADHDALTVDGIRLRERMDDFVAERGQRFGGHLCGDDDLEFISAKAAHLAHLPHGTLQPLCDLLEQGIARRVAHRIVDLLEPVEIEQKDRAMPVRLHRRIEDFLERLRHLVPVGEACQRVVACQSRRLLLASPAFGQIGSRPAETDEIVEVVVNRTTRNGPPAFLAIDSRTHRQLAEG